MAAVAILNFENRLPFHYYSTDPHQIWWGCGESNMECIGSVKNANLSKFKMAAAAISDFEKELPFHYYLTDPHQIWWGCGESNMECI